MRWDRLFMLPLLIITLSAPSCAGPGDDSPGRVLIAEASLGRGWLGIVVEDMTERMGRRMGAGVTSGALVNEVTEKSPAQKAGLKVDDIIVSVDDRTIKDANDLVRAVRKIDPETVVSIVVVRSGKRQTLPVEIGSRGGPQTQLGLLWEESEFENTILGMRLRNLTGQLAEYFKAPRGRAVLVEEVTPGSASAESGVKAGDVIIRCGSEPIRDVDDLEWVLEDAEADQKLSLEVLREGSRRTMELTVPEHFSGLHRRFFHHQMFHSPSVDPGTDLWKKHIEIELPRELRKGRLKIEGVEHSMQALQKELEVLGRQLKKEAEQAKKSLSRAMRATVL